MGHILFYKSYEHELGDVSVGRWREIQRLLPPFVEYVNGAMTLDWSSGIRRNVTVYADDSLKLFEASDAERLTILPFMLTRFLRDESDVLNEIYVEDADEVMRLFAWYDFLSARDGAASLYAPLVQTLRSCTRGIEAFASSGDT